MPSPPLVHCMHGELSSGAEARGGHALVYALEGVEPTELFFEAMAHVRSKAVRDDMSAQPPGTVAACVAAKHDNFATEAFDADGRMIRFCGHGALAAAFVVLAGRNPGTAQFSNGRQAWTARLLNEATDEATVALQFDQPECVACDVPEFAQACFHEQPIKSAILGTDTDYLVLEFAAPADVSSLQPDFAAIAAATQRAVIATARNDDSCVFRYFAPQYGNPEDAATGSAAVQLGSYWAQQMGDERMRAEQLSPAGAAMQLQCMDGKVELAARVGYG